MLEALWSKNTNYALNTISYLEVREFCEDVKIYCNKIPLYCLENTQIIAKDVQFDSFSCKVNANETGLFLNDLSRFPFIRK